MNGIDGMDLLIVGFISTITIVPLMIGFFEWLAKKLDKWKGGE